MKKVIYFLLGLFWLNFTAQAQLLNDPTNLNLTSLALDKIYNAEFGEARKYIEQIKKNYPKHPIIPFLNAYAISWENMPLQKGQTEFTYYNQYLQLSLQYAQNLLKSDKNNLEGIYFTMAAYSLLAIHESESGDFMTAVGYGKNAFQYIKKGFNLTEKFADFYFSTGVYKYYAIQYPETHPIAKPFAAFFPEGNKAKGLEYLHIAGQNSRFSKVEAYMYLHAIYAKYEQNNYQAWLSAQQLVSLYPNNSFFWLRNCESLIALGRYAEAEAILPKFSAKNKSIYQAAQNLFKGIIQEKYYKNLTIAQNLYNQVIGLNKVDKRYTKDYQAFAHAGLARIAHQTGDKPKAKENYKKALKLSEYEGLKLEAKNYLKNNN
jgi:tetratricopeptide (TPR) repeat protein